MKINNKSLWSVLLMLFFYPLSDQAVAQAPQYQGTFEYFGSLWTFADGYPVISSVTPNGPAHRSGLQPLDVITEINGVSMHGRSSIPAPIGQAYEFKIIRTGKREITTEVTPFKGPGSQPVTEYDLAMENSDSQTGIRMIRKNDRDDHPGIDALSDKDYNLLDYKTFDFEWNDARNPLQEKKVAEEIERKLTARGLKRDREDPDMIIYLTFFEDKADQYVPPTQQVNTRYGTAYNYVTKKYETRQYVDSHTVGDYTRTTYFAELSISMMDAEKLKLGESAIPPVIWSAYYGTSKTGSRINRERFVDWISYAMVMCFPFTDVTSTDIITYWYTGLGFDMGDIRRVAMVIPDSPAEKAGIRVGDIITKTDYGKIKPASASDVVNRWRYARSYYTDDSSNAFYQTRMGKFYYIDAKLAYKNVEGFKYLTRDLNNSLKNITFSILRNGKEKITVTVPAVKTTGYNYMIKQ